MLGTLSNGNAILAVSSGGWVNHEVKISTLPRIIYVPCANLSCCCHGKRGTKFRLFRLASMLNRLDAGKIRCSGDRRPERPLLVRLISRRTGQFAI